MCVYKDADIEPTESRLNSSLHTARRYSSQVTCNFTVDSDSYIASGWESVSQNLYYNRKLGFNPTISSYNIFQLGLENYMVVPSMFATI